MTDSLFEPPFLNAHPILGLEHMLAIITAGILPITKEYKHFTASILENCGILCFAFVIPGLSVYVCVLYVTWLPNSLLITTWL